jgi:acyl-coenzyme A synthetase/AMP-(fatty) acid ligase
MADQNSMADLKNLTEVLDQCVDRCPQALAVVGPSHRSVQGRMCYDRLSRSQLQSKSRRLSQAFLGRGLRKGSRVVLMIEPGPDLTLVFYGLLRIGAVPIVLDATSDFSEVGPVLGELEPELFIGAASASRRRWMARWRPLSMHSTLTTRAPWYWLGTTLEDLKPDSEFSSVDDISMDDPALICLTAGAAQGPRWIEHTHRTLCRTAAQFENDHLGGHLSSSLVIGLLIPVTGQTSVCARLDTRRPGEAELGSLFEVLSDFGPTTLSGSPALMSKIARLPSSCDPVFSAIREVLVLGAPLSLVEQERLESRVGMDANIQLLYGTTECLLIAQFSSQLRRQLETGTETMKVFGLGLPEVGLDIRLERTGAGPPSDDECRPQPGDVGVLWIRGDAVAGPYEQWICTGDVVSCDAEGYLWFLGRESDRVHHDRSVLDSVPVERLFESHDEVARAALVAAGEGDSRVPTVVIESVVELSSEQQERLRGELRDLAAARGLPIQFFLFHEHIPLDLRHGARIQRRALSLWADGQV